jgi:predicted aconitase with swiveling domain
MKTLTLKGHTVFGGCIDGEALVTKQSWAAFMAVDIYTGEVTEREHELRGMSVEGKVLVFPRGKGSSGWSIGAQALRFTGKAPKALVITEINTQSALGAAVMRVPAVSNFDHDPIEVIATGDWVRVDADKGVVEIIKRGQT